MDARRTTSGELVAGFNPEAAAGRGVKPYSVVDDVEVSDDICGIIDNMCQSLTVRPCVVVVG